MSGWRNRVGLTVVGVGLAVGALAGCSPTGVALNLATMGEDDRTLREQAKDADIKLELNKAVYDADPRIYRALGFQVWEGRVALTGAVSRPEHKERAVAIAKNIPSVKAVIDEIQIADEARLGVYLNDTVIEERLKARLLMAKDIKAANMSIRAVNGVIYLLGVAHTQEELDRVIQEARDIDAVKKVVDHVKVRPKRP